MSHTVSACNADSTYITVISTLVVSECNGTALMVSPFPEIIYSDSLTLIDFVYWYNAVKKISVSGEAMITFS